MNKTMTEAMDAARTTLTETEYASLVEWAASQEYGQITTEQGAQAIDDAVAHAVAWRGLE